MKKFLILLTLLVAGVAQAQTHNQDAGAQIGGTQVLGHTTDGTTAINTSGKWGKFAVSTYGGSYVSTQDPSSGLTQSVIPVSSNPYYAAVVDGLKAGVVVADDTIEASSTRTVLNLASNAANVGDYIIPSSGTAANLGKWYPVCADATNTITLCGTGLDATPSTDNIRIFRPRPLNGTGSASTSTNTALQVSVNSFFQDSNGGNLLKSEDSAHTTGDAGVQMLGVNNRSFATLNSSQLDYTPIAVGDVGNLYSTVVYDSTLTAAQSAVRPIDTSTISNNVGVTVLGRGDADWNPTAGTGSGRFSMFSMDSTGRQYVNTGADVGKYTQGCNTAITTATTGDIIAALASNRHYISSISCTNTGAAATRVRIQDGSATGFADLMLAATTGYASITFPTPFRTASNSAVVANVITTGSSTVCCATGYSATR